LVVDVNMARSLVLNAFNDSLSVTQMLMNQAARENNEVSASDTLLDPGSEGALAFHLRLRNLRFREEVGVYADKVASRTTDKEMQEALGLAFVFPIGHELFHLRPNARWFPRISRLIEREEARADNHASNLIERRIAGGSGFESNKMLGAQLSILSMRHFQDIVLSELLRGFRNLHAEDYLAVLFHRPCEQANQIPWPRRYHNPDVVFQAAQRGFPVLSRHEYEQIGARLKRFGNETHGSLLQRILQMRSAFRRNEDWAHIVNSSFPYAEMLDAAYYSPAGPVALARVDDGVAVVDGLSLHGLLNRLSAHQDWQQGAGCKSGECGLLRWEDGYIEAYLRDGIILHVRIVEPFDGDKLPRTGKTVSYFFGEPEAERLEREVRRFRADCRVGTYTGRNASYMMVSHVLNEEGLIETEIVAGGGQPE